MMDDLMVGLTRPMRGPIKMDGKRQKSGLTAAWVSRAKPKDEPYKLSDRDGLYLLG
jgi:hypothetical protein